MQKWDKVLKKSQDKKSQDKKESRCKEILEICKVPNTINEIREKLGYKSHTTLKRDYIKQEV